MLEECLAYEWEAISKVVSKVWRPVPVFIICNKREVFSKFNLYTIWKDLLYGNIYPYYVLFWGHAPVDCGSFSNLFHLNFCMFSWHSLYMNECLKKININRESFSKKSLALCINQILFLILFNYILNASSMEDYQPKKPKEILYKMLCLDYWYMAKLTKQWILCFLNIQRESLFDMNQSLIFFDSSFTEGNIWAKRFYP